MCQSELFYHFPLFLLAYPDKRSSEDLRRKQLRFCNWRSLAKAQQLSTWARCFLHACGEIFGSTVSIHSKSSGQGLRSFCLLDTDHEGRTTSTTLPMQIVPTKNVSVIGQLQDVSTTEYTTDINPTDWGSANVPGIGLTWFFPLFRMTLVIRLQ